MSSALRLALALVASSTLGAVAGCSGADPSSSSGTGSSASGGTSTGTVATSADSEVVSVSATTSSIADVESLTVLFTGTDASGMLSLSASDAADSLRGTAQASLTTRCGDASFSHAPGSSSLKATFASGCTLPRLGAVSGGLDIATTSDIATRSLSLAFTFDELLLEGTTYDGTYDLAVSGRGQYTVTSNLTAASASGTKTIAYSGSLAVADGGVTLDGTFAGGSIDGVHHTFGAAYADAGSISFTDDGVAETLTFTSSTPSTGMAELSIAGKTQSVDIIAGNGGLAGHESSQLRRVGDFPPVSSTEGM